MTGGSTVGGSVESVRSGSSAGGDQPGSTPTLDGNCLDDVVIGWQQKLFSNAELDFYSKKSESHFENNVLGRKLFHEAKKVDKTPRPHRICTLLDGEVVKPDDDLEEVMNGKRIRVEYLKNEMSL